MNTILQKIPPIACKLLAAVLILGITGACERDIDFPSRPEISLESIEYLEELPPNLQNTPVDSVDPGEGDSSSPFIRINLEFKDAEGDLGYDEDVRNTDTVPPSVVVSTYALIDGEFRPFYISNASDEVDPAPFDPNQGVQKINEFKSLDNLTPETNTKAIKGTLRIYIIWGTDASFLPKGAPGTGRDIFPPIDYQYEVRFDVFVRDRAGNISDTIQTPAVEVPRPS